MSVQTSVYSVCAVSVRGACGLCVSASSSAALIKAHSRPDHTRPRAATCATRGRAEIGGHVVVRGAELSRAQPLLQRLQWAMWRHINYTMPDQKAKPKANAGNGQQIEENCKPEQGEGQARRRRGRGRWQASETRKMQ